MKNKFIAALGATLFSQLLIIDSATAARSYVDFTDIWYDQATSGWGINIVQSGNSFDYIFATLFIYDPATGKPTWVTGELKLDNDSKDDVFTGPLYRHTSKPTGTPFDPVKPLNSENIGTLTFTATAPDQASISYSVGGMKVERKIVRQTLTGNTIIGTYYGSVLYTYESGDSMHCPLRYGPMNITVKKDSGITTFILTVPDGAVVCNLKGTLQPSGRTAKIDNAQYICWDKTTGRIIQDIKVDVSNIVATTQGIEGEFTAKKESDFCSKGMARFSAILY